jgi:hypothetical protein
MQLLTGLAEGRVGALDLGFLADQPNNILHGGRPVCHPREQLQKNDAV